MPPTYSMPASFSRTGTSTEPTRPWWPATATRICPFMSRLVSPTSVPAATAVAAAAIASAEAAALPRGRWHRQGGCHHLGVDLLVYGQALRRQLFDGRLPAEVQP